MRLRCGSGNIATRPGRPRRRRTFLNLTAGAAVLPAVSRVAWANYRPPIQEVIGFIEAHMREFGVERMWRVRAAERRNHQVCCACYNAWVARSSLKRGTVPGTEMPDQCSFARMITSERVPTKMRLRAQVASRLNQLRDTNLRPR
jgi:hypothetical protein